MVISHRCVYGSFSRPSRCFDRPIYIHYLSVFIGCVLDDFYSPEERSNFRLFDDDGNLIGRAASYEGVSYVE